MKDLKQDIETLFQVIDESVITSFCKDYAMNNSDFAELLINVLLLPRGETTEEQLMSLPSEVEACFIQNIYNGKALKCPPFLNWYIVNSKLSKLIRRGEYFVENDYIYEAIFLSTNIIDRTSEMYIEDEVWSDQNLDGEITAIRDSVSLIERILNLNILRLEMLQVLYNEINRLCKMEAHQEYGLFNFDYIQERIMDKIIETED